jgi:serine/threonine protein phosphatase PrpC
VTEHQQAYGGQVANSDVFPVLHQRSRAAAEPWRLPDSPSPSGLAADQGTVGSLEIRAASVIGPAHRCSVPALPRQDAYRLGQDSARKHLIIAVADGMSDSRHSDAGANIAAAAAVGNIRSLLDNGVPTVRLDAREIFTVAAGQMLGAAEQRGWQADEVRSVLAVAVVQTAAHEESGIRQAWLATLADVTAWRWRADGWDLLLGDLKDDGAIGELEYYLPYHPDRSQSDVIDLGPADVLAIMTDGLGDAISMLPDAAAWFASKWREPPDVARFMVDVGYEDSQFNDDRTAVVVWCLNEAASQ